MRPRHDRPCSSTSITFARATSSATLQQWLFEALVQPVVFGLGIGNLLEDAFDATGWLLVGLIQMR